MDLPCSGGFSRYTYRWLGMFGVVLAPALQQKACTFEEEHLIEAAAMLGIHCTEAGDSSNPYNINILHAQPPHSVLPPVLFQYSALQLPGKASWDAEQSFNVSVR